MVGISMELNVVVQSIVIISLMILIGAGLSKTLRFNQDTRSVFISIIVNVAVPCIILSSIFNVEMNEERFKMMLIVFGLSVVINVIGIMIGWLLTALFFRKSKYRNEFALLSGLGNTGFIGIPLCAVLLGPEGALYAAIFDAGVDFTIWTLAVFMLQKQKSFSFSTLKAMVNIPLVAIIVGMILSYFHFRPSTLFINLVDQLAALAAPMAMFYIGFLIMTLERKKVGEVSRQIWLPISIKLFVLPMITALLMFNFQYPYPLIETVMIQSMMPTITLASILFAKYHANENLGAMTTVVATLISMLTIPMMIYLMNIFLLNT